MVKICTLAILNMLFPKHESKLEHISIILLNLRTGLYSKLVEVAPMISNHNPPVFPPWSHV